MSKQNQAILKSQHQQALPAQANSEQPEHQKGSIEMVDKPFSRMYLNVDDHSSANATEDRDTSMKKKKNKHGIYETMSSENKHIGR